MGGMKICTQCNTTKSLLEFHKHSKNRDGLRHICKSCVKTYRDANLEKSKAYDRDRPNKVVRLLKTIEYQRENPQVNHKASTKRNLRKYWPHLSFEEALAERQKLFDKQNGCCAICFKPETDFKRKLAVDHNHKTGKVRGLLCYVCNRFKVAKNTFESVEKLMNYFKEYDPKP